MTEILNRKLAQDVVRRCQFRLLIVQRRHYTLSWRHRVEKLESIRIWAQIEIQLLDCASKSDDSCQWFTLSHEILHSYAETTNPMIKNY